jgi:hypothetical protein
MIGGCRQLRKTPVRLCRDPLRRQVDGIHFDVRVLVEILNAIVFAARIAVDTLVLATTIQIHSVLYSEKWIRLFG